MAMANEAPVKVPNERDSNILPVFFIIFIYSNIYTTLNRVGMGVWPIATPYTDFLWCKLL